MQNRYVGDVGDFAKYYILRRLSGEGTPTKPLSLGIVWYLVPDDHDRHDQNDGKHIGYLGLKKIGNEFVDEPKRRDIRLQDLDRDLFHKLRSLVLADTRNVKAVISTGVFSINTEAYDSFPGGQGYELPPHQFKLRQERRVAWCDHICNQASKDILFLDPDNGLSLPGHEINTSISGGKRDAVKYVLPEEISKFYEKALVALVVYHHLSRRSPHSEQVTALADAVRQHLNVPEQFVAPIRCNRGSGRVYLVIQKPGSDLSSIVDGIRSEFIHCGLWNDRQTQNR